MSRNANTMPITPFTETEIRSLVTYVRALGASMPFMHPSANWKDFDPRDVSVEDMDNEGDTLTLNGPLWGANIMRVRGEKPAIVPVPCVQYAVCVPVTIYSNSRWEPDDTDWKEIALVDTLHEAVAALFLHEMETHCRDIAMAVQYETEREGA